MTLLAKFLGKPQFSNTKVRGFTLAEAVVALGLSSLIILVLSSQIGEVNQTSTSTQQTLEQSSDLVQGYRVLIDDLRGAQFLKLGYFSCSDQSGFKLFSTDSQSTFDLAETSPRLSFVTSDKPLLVGLASDGQRVVVPSIYNFQIGDWVVLSLAQTPSVASLFYVDEIDKVGSTLLIKSGSFAISGYSCVSNLSQSSVASFFAPSLRSNVFLYKISPVDYKWENGSVYRTFYRRQDPIKFLLLSNISRLRFLSRWLPDLDEPAYGKMSIQFDVILRDSSLPMEQLAARSVGSIYQAIQTNKAEFELRAPSQLNEYVPQGVPTAAVAFPGCNLKIRYEPRLINMPPWQEWWRNMYTFTLTGEVSEAGINGATILVTLVPSGNSRMSCFAHDPFRTRDTTPYPSYNAWAQGTGTQGPIAINQRGGGFDVYTCAATGEISLNATMSYYDTVTSSVKNIDCSSVTVRLPTQYRFHDGLPWCKKNLKNGGLEYGVGSRVVGRDVDQPMGRLSLLGWQWEGENVDLNQGRVWGSLSPPSPGAKIKRLFFYPYKLTIYDKNGNLWTKPEGVYVDCD